MQLEYGESAASIRVRLLIKRRLLYTTLRYEIVRPFGQNLGERDDFKGQKLILFPFFVFRKLFNFSLPV